MDAATPAPRYHGYFQILILLALMQVALIGIAAFLGLQKLERAVSSIERSEQRFQSMADAAAPLGKAGIEKAQAVLDKLDADRLSEGTTESLRELGSAARERALEILKTQGKTAEDAPQ